MILFPVLLAASNFMAGVTVARIYRKKKESKKGGEVNANRSNH